jgi:uncharacterized membrane protein
MLDCKLLWSKHIDTTVASMGISLSIIKCCSAFRTALSTGPTGLSFFTLGLYFSRVVSFHKDLVKLQLAKNRAGWLALGRTQN